MHINVIAAEIYYITNKNITIFSIQHKSERITHIFIKYDLQNVEI